MEMDVAMFAKVSSKIVDEIIADDIEDGSGDKTDGY